MLSVETLLLFVPAALALILAPGPDTIYVLTRALGAGKRVGLRSAAGISVGVLVHTAAAVLGLSVLLRRSTLAFRLLKYVGAAYLLYLGVRALRSPGRFELGEVATDGPTDETSGAEDGSEREGTSGANEDGGGFARGVLVNALNPKVALFFLAFLPQFVPAGAPTAPLTLSLLGGLYAALTCCYLSGVALVSGSIRGILHSSPRIEEGLRYGTGSVLIGLGAGLAFESV
jgi:threonine/homoserine/homoserine lactone efflux protein